MQYSENLADPSMMAIVPVTSPKSSEFTSSSPESSGTPTLKEESSPTLPQTGVPLTPVWEHIVRSKNLPESVDLDGLFKVIHQRIRNPEWTVRQHALRVLKDIIPLLGGGDSLDERMQTVLADIVANLGHLGPGVRKAAVDCLKTYLHHSQRTDRVLYDLVLKGVKNAAEYKVQPNMVLGIILALPFLLRGNKKVSQNTIEFAIHCLLDKLVQVTHQDTVMRALLRIKESIGAHAFDNHLEMYWQPTIKKDFEALCDVYNLSSFIVEPGQEGGKPPEDDEYKPPGDPGPHLGDVKTNFYYMKDESSATRRPMWPDSKLGPPDKVILETEIRLNSGPAITMKIHEEDSGNLDATSDEKQKEGADVEEDAKPTNTKTFRVIRDDSIDPDPFYDDPSYDQARRTPRRVRFGGEIVKMRTPDSDSNHPSDADGESPRIGRPKGGGKSLIPVSLARTKKDGLIGLDTQSAPSSPNRSLTRQDTLNPKNKKLSHSSPNLSRNEDALFGNKIAGRNSRIPKKNGPPTRKGMEVRDGHRSKAIRKSQKKADIMSSPRRSVIVLEEPTLSDERKQQSKDQISDDALKKQNKHDDRQGKLEPPPKGSTGGGRIINDRSRDQYSPIPIHNEIEVIHNLTRSPERPKQESKDHEHPKHSIQTQTSENGNPALSKFVEKPVVHSAESHKSHIPANVRNRSSSARDFNGNLEDSIETRHHSFHVYKGNKNISKKNYDDDFVDPVIPTKNGGPCLTCSSSSGSDTAAPDTPVEKIETLGIVDKKIVKDLQCRDDVWRRHYALQELHQEMRSNPAVVESLETSTPTFFQLMFTLMDQQSSLIQPLTEQIVIWFLNKCSVKLLTNDRVQTILLLGLSRMGSPAGVRMALVLAQRIPPGRIVDKLVSDQILGAKSSKVREGSLQILMAVCRLFPSTEVDVPGTVARLVPALVGDKKSRVRRAALEALAALAQLGSPGLVLDVAAGAAANRDDGEMLMGVVRSRLSRRQLPAVDVRNGTIRYSTPCPLEEDWVSMGSSTPPASSQDSGGQVKVHQQASKSAMPDRRLSMSNNNLPLSMERPRRASAMPVANYWKRNSHKNRILGSSNYSPVITKDQHIPVWAIDSKNFAVNQEDVFNNQSNGLRPLYVVQPQTNLEKHNNINKRDATTNYERIHLDPEAPPEDRRMSGASTLPRTFRAQRGRSFSPPKHHSTKNTYKNETNKYYESDEEYRHRFGSCNGLVNGEQHRQYDGGGYMSRNGNSRNNLESARGRNMRKSFSTEQLPNPVGKEPPPFIPDRRVLQLQSQPLSSGSSTGSGASMRDRNESASNWYRHGRSRQGLDASSGIPLPVTMPPINTNSKIRLRTTTMSGDVRRVGPLAAVTPVSAMSEPIYTERNHLKTLKPSSSQRKHKFIMQQEEMGLDEPDQAVTRQPFSSGSDSSGYFTPPAEPQMFNEDQHPHHNSYDDDEEEEVPEAPPPPDVRLQQQTPHHQDPQNDERIDLRISTPTSAEIHQTPPGKSFVRVETEEIEEDVPVPVGSRRNSNENGRSPPTSDTNFAQTDAADSSDDEAESEDPKVYTPISPQVPSRRMSFSETAPPEIYKRKFEENRELSKSFGDIKLPQGDFESARKLVSSAPLLKEKFDLNTKGLLEVSPIKLAKTPLPGTVVLDEDYDDDFEDTNRNFEIIEEINQNFVIQTKDEKHFEDKEKSPQKHFPSQLPQPIYRKKSNRMVSKAVIGPVGDPPPPQVQPQRQPREHVTDILLKLSSPEWEKVVQGLEAAGRLFKNQTEITDTHLHQLATSVGRHIRNLRSQVARAACLVASEAFKHPRRNLEAELEEFAVPLLHRTADTNRFLRGDANAALDDVIACNQLPPPKVVQVLTAKGGAHQNAVVRCTTARLLCALCQKIGSGRIFQLPKDTRDRILLCGANMLTEGSLETRKHAKIMLGFLAQHCHFQKAMEEAVPITTRRHISKTLESLK